MALFDLTALNDVPIDAPARAISNCSSSQSTPIKSTVNWVPFPVRLGSHDSKWNVVMKALLFLAIIVLAGARANADDASSTTIPLSASWKFHKDPTNIGASQSYQWYADAFDDHDWETRLSGKSWESQGLNYSGFAWYRQKIFIPEKPAGAPLQLNLAALVSDDDVYFNGVHVGGLKGGYKYDNLLNRVYIIPTSLVRYGSSNTVAIRIWGGSIDLQRKNSGLVVGTYTIVMTPLRVSARPSGGSLASEKPIELYDLSAASQGAPFELVFPYLPSLIPSGGRATLTFALSDFYGFPIKTGTVPLTIDGDGIVRGIVSVDSASARALYLAGHFQATLVVKNETTGATLSNTVAQADHLSFANRDDKRLNPLPTKFEATPYGLLKLVDTIDCSTDAAVEEHPYLQSAFGQHRQDRMTPGARANVSVNSILGKLTREANWSWFAYRIGRGDLTVGKTYLLRMEYPEDKPRYSPVEIQVGQNYMDVGWKSGLASNDVYENWPLSFDWQYYDVIVSVGNETTATGGAGDGNAEHGFWVYFMDKRKPGFYFSPYSGGPAVANIKLYEIDPISNAPNVVLPPAGVPQRVMTVDWERQPTSAPADMVNYARLMGYSAVSPVILKWGFSNYGDPVAGYDSANVDAAHYLVTSHYASKSRTPPAPAVPGVASVHAQYLEATKRLGLDYIPRFEYGGSYELPSSAWAVAADGNIAKPNRFAKWGANLLNSATFADLKIFMDSFIKPYAATNPQLIGALWRIRSDRMQISYGRDDVALFCKETGAACPSGSTNAQQVAEWASTEVVGPNYATWWHGKRRDFHQQLVNLLKSYRSDLTLYYYNWDSDKFSLMEPDLNSAAFYQGVASMGGVEAYEIDRLRRATYTVADYLNVLTNGDFSGSFLSLRRPDANWADYALRPSLYANVTGMELLAPVNSFAYAKFPDYINYFATHEGLAVSNALPYDEVGAREPNPKYEGSMVLPGRGPFSMAMELLSYYYGDARTLTYTAYTYGRGFADAHRRFAQAFRALPAIRGSVLPDMPSDVAVRLYQTGQNGTYIGIAYKGYANQILKLEIPGSWTRGMVVTNLVTGEVIPTMVVGDKLEVVVQSGPMELNTLLVK
jgi:hypothetical protein